MFRIVTYVAEFILKDAFIQIGVFPKYGQAQSGKVVQVRGNLTAVEFFIKTTVKPRRSGRGYKVYFSDSCCAMRESFDV